MTNRSGSTGPPEPSRPRARSDPHRRLCPRCNARTVQRWGRFAGRQRYRCRCCRRTFSTFTGTALYYLKRVDRWDAFRSAMRHGLTVRAAAVRVGIHRDTAFRWRHLLLHAVERGERVIHSGHLALGSTSFPYSAKGSRTERRSDLVGDHLNIWGHPRVWVALARDEHGASSSAIQGPARLGAAFFDDFLRGRVMFGTTVRGHEGPFSTAAVCARRLGLDFLPLCRSDQTTDPEPIPAYAVRIKRWLVPFRGVATRYLSHYLVWFRLTDTRWMGECWDLSSIRPPRLA
jgi:transposase-like protein